MLRLYGAFDNAKDVKEITWLNGAQYFPAETLAGGIGSGKESAQKSSYLRGFLTHSLAV
jgi:hypothetical protein